MRQAYIEIATALSDNKQKHFWKKIKCNVRMMIDRNVAEKKFENKVEMSSY